MKKILAWIVTLAMLCGIMPLTAFSVLAEECLHTYENSVCTGCGKSELCEAAHPIDIFVFAGQSNMMGAAVLEPKVDQFTNQAWEYKYMPKLRGMETGFFVSAQNPAGEWHYIDMDTAYGDQVSDLSYQSSLSNYGANTYFCPAMRDGTKGFSAQSEANTYPGASLAPYFVTEYAEYGHSSIYAHMAKGAAKIDHYFTEEMATRYNALISEYNTRNNKSYSTLTLAGLSGAGDAFDNKYNAMLEDYAALAPNSTAENKCFVWLQGEGDAGRSYIEYKLKMQVLWEHLQDLGFTHFFVLRVGYWGSTGILNVIKAQEDFCAENENCHIVTRTPSLIPYPGTTTDNWWISEPSPEYDNCRDSYLVDSGNNHFNEKAMQIFAERSAENVHRILHMGLEPVLEEENIRGMQKEEELPEDDTPYTSYVGTEVFCNRLSVSQKSNVWKETSSSSAASTDLIPVNSDDSIWIQYVFFKSDAHAVGGFYDVNGQLVAPLWYKDFGFTADPNTGGVTAFRTPVKTNRVSVADLEAVTGKKIAYVRFTAWAASTGGHADTSARIYHEEHTHSYDAVVTAPTCTEQGYTTHTCACGDKYVDGYKPATGHTYENGVCTGCGAKIPNSISLRYDDHYDVTGKTVEIIDTGKPTSYQVGYGMAENAVRDTAVVTLQGDSLIATGIGTATVKIDGVLHEITVESAPISLLLLIGQSNMRGSEGNANQSIVCPEGMVYATYGDDRGADNTAMSKTNARLFAPSALAGKYSSINVEGTTECLSGYPVYSLNEAGAGKIGPDSGFAYEWVQQTGEKVWVVNAAHGGTSINLWQDGGKEFEECERLFKACQETLRKEIAAGHFTLSHMAYFWCQGCSDAANTAEQYAKKYLSMHESLKTVLAFDHDSDSATADYTFEFGGIIPVRAGNATSVCYREGVYTDTTTAKYHESFKDLRFTGPRVAQYWMINHPELPDIWGVCNIGEDWVWMPDGTNGVADYFNAHYENGTVDYKPQVSQKASWYKPTTPAAVHDSIHYNQIGYNEIGRESVRNALIMLGEMEAPDVETTVELLSWDGYNTVDTITAAITGTSNTLVVPKVYPVWKAKEVTYDLSDGLIWNYYDLLAENVQISGTLEALGQRVTVVKTEPGAHYVDHLSELPENVCCGLNLWTLLEHDPEFYHSGTHWATHGTKDVMSVTIPVMPGDKIFATAFGKAGTNGHETANGIRVTFFNEYGAAKTTDPAGTYKEFVANGGYLIVPEGATAANIPMWTNDNSNELYILNRFHDTSNGICGICGKDSHVHEWGNWEMKEIPGKGEPVTEERACSGCGETETREVESVWQKYDLAAHYSDLSENVCSGLNLWNVLEHDKYYFANGTNWGKHSSGNVYSVTIPVETGERIFATAWGKAVENGHATANGIRVSFFSAYGVAKTMTPAECYAEFSANGGYLVAPEGAVAVNIAMWNNSDENEVYLLDREHPYTSTVTAPTCTAQGYTTHTCETCGESYVDDYVDATGHVYDDDRDADCNVCGTVRDLPALLGDANGDGKVNNRDLGLLQQYLADMDVEVVLAVCDFTADGRVNNRDLGLLQQRLSDFE